jgi:hypothetical protein
MKFLKKVGLQYVTAMKLLWPKNTNKNCLKGMRCPECGQFDMLKIDTKGVQMGDSIPSTFRPTYTDDGFDDPLCDGNTRFVKGGESECPECGHEGPTRSFHE